MRAGLATAVSVLGVAACAAFGPRPMHVDARSAAPRLVGDYAARVESDAMWHALAAEPEHAATARTESVKTIIDLEDHGRLYFLESKQWFFHYHFVKEFIDPVHSLAAFNEEQYHSSDRRFILGEVIHYRDPDIWAYELAWLDTLDVKRTIESFEKVKAAMWNGDKLRYHPVPSTHLAAIAQLRGRVPIATTDEIFGGTRYQAVNPGEAFGTLRFASEPFDPTSIGPHDIVVLDGAPLDLPVCAGVITSQFQAPLSHVAVLSTNRHTPDMTLRGAIGDATLRALAGKLVRLEVTLHDFAIGPATAGEAERAWKERQPGKPLHLRRKDKDVGLPTLASFDGGDTALVGAKAAQLGELRRFVAAGNLPRAFAVPFHEYVEHLRRNGIDGELTRMLADAGFRGDRSRRERALAELRARIEHAPVDGALIARIREKIAALFPDARVRFRSSTNAEDLAGFNGAGLYTSTIAPAHATDVELADALRKVWASVWSFQGFEERSYFGIAPEDVGMAVLVQESIDDIAGIGVAITGNPYDRDHAGYLVNVQDPAGSVTSPGPGEVPEQALVHTSPELSIERLSSSSLRHDRQLMSDRELMTLAQLLSDIHRHFCGDNPEDARAMDVEFLVAGKERRIVIVQARPYRMTWGARGYRK